MKRDAKQIVPAFCCFGIVDECMFRCKMCEKWKEDISVKSREALPFDTWKDAIFSLKKIVPDPSSFVINFGGGEALLRDDLLELVRVANGEGFITNIASNGWLIDEACAERIAHSGLRSINLSLDSVSAAVHDELRGKPGATEQVLRAIDHLRSFSSKLEIGICSVFYEANHKDILSLTRWVQKNEKVNWIVFMAAMQPNNTDFDASWMQGDHGHLWPKSRMKMLRLITYLKWLKWWGWKIQNPYYQLDAFKKYFWNPGRFVKYSTCNMDKAVHISATGDIFLCFRHEKLGNIATDSIADVWNSETAARARTAIHACKDNCHFLLNCYFEKEYPFQFAKRY